MRVISIVGLVAINAIASNWTVATRKRERDLLDDSKASPTFERNKICRLDGDLGDVPLSVFRFTRIMQRQGSLRPSSSRITAASLRIESCEIIFISMTKWFSQFGRN